MLATPPPVPMISAPAELNVLAYPATFFAPAQPATALDMIVRLPGFSLDAGNAEVRGFAGAAGNVLIDGRRPTTKDDTLEEVLKRLAAGSIDRIELIRGGARGLDMGGYGVLANVVRRREVAVRLQAEASLGAYPDGRTTPSVRIDGSRRSGDRLVEASLNAYRSVDDEKGRGRRNRLSPAGALVREQLYDEHDGFTGAEGSLAHERGLLGGRLRANAGLKRVRERAATLQLVRFPTQTREDDLELETVTSGEAGVNWEGSLGGRLGLELVGLQRLQRTRASQRADDGRSVALVQEANHGGESIARAVLRWKANPRLTVEGGGEATINVLDSSTALAVGGVAVPLPAAQVKVRETRGEAFATATWTVASKLVLEAGGRIEVSRLVQTGDSDLVKSFLFPKPRVLLSWSPDGADQIRVGLERKVGQLDFGDFVSSASLTSNTLTAGNAALEPDRRWIATANWDRRFAGGATVVLGIRHDRISHVLDRVGLFGPGYALDAPGNIGRGQRTRVSADFTLPLDRLRIAGGLLKGSVGYRWTSVTDPTTGLRRPISKEEPIDGAIHFTQDLPAQRFRWGADLELGIREREYRFNEVRRSSRGGKLGLFAEYRPAAGWTVRAFAQNVTSRNVRRVRTLYPGSRALNLPNSIEDRDLNVAPHLGITVRRTFGHKA